MKAFRFEVSLIILILIAYLFSFSGIFFISYNIKRYEHIEIPSYKIETIQHNLESTPIFDILSDDKCENNNTSNILGYFYGFDSGFINFGTFYPGDTRKEYCNKSYSDCIYIKSQEEIQYKSFKGRRLCTSKRPNKNYFDYFKSSVGFNENCKKGFKICGKLDVNRFLCIKEDDNCPINDIIYNNFSEYINNGIMYHTIEINENEYLHYTNEQIYNYIITNLSVIGQNGKGYPCGGNDNEEYEYFSPMDKNAYCTGPYYTFKYYYYKYLSSINLEQFYIENNLNVIEASYFQDLKNKGNMSLFSTGYFSLSSYDIKNLKVPSGFNKNNNYSIIMEKYSKIDFILFIIAGIYFLYACVFSVYFFNKIFCFILFLYILYIIMVIILNVYSIKVVILDNKIFKLTGSFPSFLFDDIKKMKNPNGKKRFWINLTLLIYQISIFVLLIYVKKVVHKKDDLFKNTINNTLLISNEAITPSKDYEITPTPSKDYEITPTPNDRE